MNRLHTSFVLGFHGCDAAKGKAALAGDLDRLNSDKAYDWLGPGMYFWESDPVRAMEWAEDKVTRGEARHPFVVGAVIDLGNCLDLTLRDNLEVLRAGYLALEKALAAVGTDMPKNLDPASAGRHDKLLRFLDCAVIKRVHADIEAQIGQGKLGADDRYDSVRGLFVEGDPIYPGSSFRHLSHTQIAVRSQACIKGLFRPR